MDQLEKMMAHYHINLNEQQRAAVRRVDGATLLLAVPGSGKTTVIICRLGYMIQCLGIERGSILTVTFSRAGARDLGRRYEKTFGKSGESQPDFSTIHSFALSVIRRYERRYNRKAFDILEDNGRVLRQIYLEKQKAYPNDSDISDLQSAITLCKNRMADQEAIAKMKVGDLDFPTLYQAYETYKRQNHLMDFDDMLKYAYLLLRKHRDLLRSFTDRYRYINVDEAQDTSTVQFAILHLLTEQRGNLFLVGDEDQSIYRFRGANPQELLHFKQRYPGGEVLLMETNHRSTAQLVAASDHFITLNQERYQKHMITHNAKGVPPVHQVVHSVEEEYRFLLTAVQKEGKEMAILYRNNESAIPLVDLFEREKVAYQLKEHNPLFFSHFIVKDIRDFFMLAQDPTDLEIFSRMYYKMNCGISRQNVAAISHKAQHSSVFDALLNLPDLPEWLENKVVHAQKGFVRLARMNPGMGVHRIVDELGYREHLDYRIEHGYREKNMHQKLSILQILANRAENQAQFFTRMDELAAILRGEGEKGRPGGVTLSTIHSSKGLEFEKVFVIDAVEGEFPAQAALEDTPEGRKLMNEEVRLFYVGATRAKKELEFISERGKNAPPVSRFIPFYMNETPPKKKKSKTLPKPSIGQLGAKYLKRQHRRKKMVTHWQTGDTLTHRQFGTGKIIAVSGENATVRFEKSGERRLNLAICEEHGILGSGSSLDKEK